MRELQPTNGVTPGQIEGTGDWERQTQAIVPTGTEDDKRIRGQGDKGSSSPTSFQKNSPHQHDTDSTDTRIEVHPIPSVHPRSESVSRFLPISPSPHLPIPPSPHLPIPPSPYPSLCQRAWVEIDRAALYHNVRQLKTLLMPSTQLMAVVKADAYGHGAIVVARTALEAGAGGLCVATLQEGIQLREAGIEAPILLLGATNTPEQVRAIAHWQLQPTICTPQQALMFSDALGELEISLPVHLKLDTGMSRLGTPWQEATPFAQLVRRLPYVKIESIYSHLATADSPDPTVMKLQHQRFEEAIAQLREAAIEPPRLHLANSAATLAAPALHYDMVRVGLALYGLYPAEHLRRTVDLKPVMQVKARVTQVKTIPAGTGVSYGYQFIANRELRLAVVGIGYADGVPRNLSNKMTVLIRGQQVPQIGAITMDQLMLDVSTIPDLQAGEVVTLIGQDGEASIGADDWAQTLGTISWEILCSFKHRLPRVAIGD